MHRIKEIVASQLRRQRVRTNQNLDKMANLKELCGSIPQSIIHTATNYEVARRKVAAHKRQQREYNERMRDLDMEQCIFEQCKRNRTQKRVRNTWSTEQAGRNGGGTIIATLRNNKNHVTQVCRVSANRY